MDTKDNKLSVRKKVIGIIDQSLFIIGIAILFVLLFSSSRLNIRSDSVDYYAILQKLTPDNKEAIVENLHFADQRSPGYPILSLVPYFVLDWVVDPLVETEKVTDYSQMMSSGIKSHPPRRSGMEPPPGSMPDGERSEDTQRPEGMSSEFRMIPPVPVTMGNILFTDYYVPQMDSWFQWKIVFSLFLTSFIFLLIGIVSNVLLIKEYFKSYKGLFIIPLVLLISPVFLRNITDFPLYTTLTVYGLSSLFLYWFIKSNNSQKPMHAILSGLAFGFLVLTRLELVVLILPVFVFLFFPKNFNYLKNMILGGLLPMSILLIYNYNFYGSPLNFAILKGDINILTINFAFINENVFNPKSGVLFWTPVLLPGLLLLLFSRKRILIIAGVSAFTLLALYLLKIPIMYFHIGEGFMEIGGIPVHIPANEEQMRFLIRSDINRYITVLIPFALLGLRNVTDKLLNRIY